MKTLNLALISLTFLIQSQKIFANTTGWVGNNSKPYGNTDSIKKNKTELSSNNSKEDLSQQPFPVNLDSIEIKAIEKNPGKWHKKIVAFDSTVSEIKIGYHDKPFYKVTLGDEYLWVAGHGKKEEIKIGAVHRTLGYLAETGNDEINLKYNSKKFFIISIAFIDLKTKQGSAFPPGKPLYDIWLKGTIPKE